jgi:Fe-S-cluster containining protein
MDETKKPSKTTILLPRSTFKFACRPGISCYTSCCANVNIFLTPYDVLRLRKGLRLSSGEFLERFTKKLVGTNPVVPLVLLKMGEDPSRRCPFVTDEGCTVYGDRPWACRMFPLDMEVKDKYSIMTDQDRCKGLMQSEEQNVADWLETQGVHEYDLMNELYEQFTGDDRIQRLDVSNPQIKSMVFMATYDLDSFRRFIFESKFLKLFDLEEERIEKIRTDELELLLFGLDWIKFGLFGEKTIRVKREETPSLHPSAAE